MNLICEKTIQNLEKWDGLSTDFKGSKINTSLDRKIVGYYDNKNLLHILIKSNETEFKKISRRGMSVSFRNVKFRNDEEHGALDFVCNSIGFDLYFIKIVNEIIEKSIEENNVEKTTPIIIESWYHFLELPRKSKLSFHELVGLIGELKSIEKFHLYGISADKIIECWTGPSGGRRDFIFGESEIEVKTSAKQEGHIHRIHGIDQLSHTGSEKIYVYSWNILKDVSEQAFNINNIIENIERNIFSDPTMLAKFHNALYEIGFDKRDAEDYKDDRFRTIDERVCEVNEDFPKIGRQSFTTLLNNRIIKIEYDIDLNGFETVSLNSVLNEI